MCKPNPTARFGVCLRHLARTAVVLLLSSIQGYAQSPDLARTTYVALPQSFEPNLGQTGRGIDFISRGPGFTFSLTANQADLQFVTTEPRTPSQAQVRTVRITLQGANSHAHAQGRQLQSGTSNYFIGNSRRAWRTGVPQYGRVEYEKVYSGIDLAYYGNRQQLEYDFLVAPRADPRRIRLAVEGADRIRVDDNGDLLLSVGSAEIRQRKPYLYQDAHGGRHSVEGKYVIRGRNRVGFEIASYDRRRPLTIDPVLVFSTYFGGNSEDTGTGIKLDATGNMYISGTTGSTNFQGTPIPGTPPGQPLNGTGTAAYVAKISPSGTLVYSSYIGGTNDLAFGNGVAVDSNGNAYLVGSTIATNFPTVNPIQSVYGGDTDAFVLELNSSGNGLVYSTYLGGSAIDYANGIEVDASANAYVTGSTGSSNFPTMNAEQASLGSANWDAFAAKISTGGTGFIYSTYIGGSSGQFSNGLAIDTSGNFYAFGDTVSTDFPVTQNAFQTAYGGGGSDGWVLKLSATGSVIYGTYIGGSAGDSVRGAKVDASGNLFFAGTTASTNFPTLNAIQPNYGGGENDAWVACLNPTGSALIYSTYLGGSSDDEAGNLAIDANDNAYVVGETSSANFPTVNAIQNSNAGGYDAFLTKINAAGTAFVFSTYLGGSGADLAEGVAVNAGTAYLTGSTSSVNFPTVNPMQASYGGGAADAFIAILETCSFTFTPPNVQFASIGGSGSVAISTTPECGWTATSNNSWITITSSTSGQGSGSISYTVAPNSGGSQLTGSITIGDVPFSVMEYGNAVTLTSVSPTSGVQGTSVPVTLTGTNFGAGSMVNVSGSGVTVSNVVVVSATQITATFQIAANAATGADTVTVTSGGLNSNGVTFTVTTTTTMLPVLNSLSPASGGAGNSVPVTLTGTNFVAGASLSSTNLSLSFSNVNVVSSTQITATFTLAANASAGSAPVMVTTSYGTSNAVNYTIQAAFTPIRVDAGSTQPYTDALGQVWSADTGFTGGNLFSFTHSISGTPAPVLYETVHYNNASFTYETGVPNGQYTVDLKFDENICTQKGQRLFNVVINGQQVLTDFDMFAAAGAQYQAVDVPIPVTVTTGEISIEFVPVVGYPGIFAIEIVAGTPAGPTVTSITPNTGMPGNAVPVTLVGTNLLSDVVINGQPNITVSNVVVVSATQVTATFNIAATAAPGHQNVTVTTEGGTTTPTTFTIQ